MTFHIAVFRGYMYNHTVRGLRPCDTGVSRYGCVLHILHQSTGWLYTEPTRMHTRAHTQIYNIYFFPTATMIRERASLLRYKYTVCLVPSTHTVISCGLQHLYSVRPLAWLLFCEVTNEWTWKANLLGHYQHLQRYLFIAALLHTLMTYIQPIKQVHSYQRQQRPLA